MSQLQGSDVPTQEYAWNWFALHSGQRLQLVNFWLVAVAFLVGAFVQAKASHLTAIAAVIAFVGVVASLAFLLLDIRTRQLVRVSEDALRYLEARRFAGEAEVLKLVTRSHVNRSFLHSYRIVIQGLQLAMAGAFVLAGIYALVT